MFFFHIQCEVMCVGKGPTTVLQAAMSIFLSIHDMAK